MKIAAFLPKLGDKVHKTAYEAITAARQLQAAFNGEVLGFAIDLDDEQLQTTAKYGLHTAFVARHALLQNTYSPSAFAKILHQFATAENIDIFIFPNITYGKELGPRLAVALSAGYIADVINIAVQNGEILFKKPVYAGKAVITAKLRSEKKVFTIRPNIFTAKETDAAPEFAIHEFTPDISEADFKEKRVAITRSSGKLDVAEADIVVSGGRGLKAPENFKLVEELAAVLGAAVGASRAVVDAGWRPHSEQVGQTGKTISPNLYIAIGISGAVQHLAGMSSSKVIVAINKDKDAPIFQVADYGIVGDALDVVPRLTEKLKAVLQKT